MQMRVSASKKAEEATGREKVRVLFWRRGAKLFFCGIFLKFSQKNQAKLLTQNGECSMIIRLYRKGSVSFRRAQRSSLTTE